MFRTMENFDFQGKRVLIRVDINSPVKDGKLDGFTKIRAATETLNELSKKNAKVVAISHQGKKGEEDFISLKQHARKLSEFMLKDVQFVEDVVGESAVEKINSLKDSEILLLENVRFVEGEAKERTAEEHAQGELVTKLAPLFDVFINDAFPSCHRSHASIVGFTKVLPSLTGRLLEREVNFLELVTKDPERPMALMFGGAKTIETLAVIKNMIERADKVIVYGVLGHLFLVARGFELGEPTMQYLEKEGHLDNLEETKRLVVAFDDKIETPIDFAITSESGRLEINTLPTDEMIKDIGSKTIEKYSEILDGMKTVIVKGPAGVYEEKDFENGTKELFKKASEVKFSMIGGGHTTDSLEDFGIDAGKFTHVSLSGGAFIEYLAGKKLPGIEALKIPYEDSANT